MARANLVATGEEELAFARKVKVLSEDPLARGELDKSDTFVYSADLIIPPRTDSVSRGMASASNHWGIVNEKIVIDYRLWPQLPEQ